MPKVMSLPSFQFRLEEDQDEQDIQNSNNSHTGTVLGNERFSQTRRNFKRFYLSCHDDFIRIYVPLFDVFMDHG